MAGAYLPPVVTELTAEIGDVLTKIADVKAAIKSIGSSTVKVGIDIDPADLAKLKALQALINSMSANVRVGATVSAAQIAAAAAAAKALASGVGAAGNAAGSSIPVWHRWLDLIHFGFAIFGENLVADTIGIIAFASSAVANFGPVAEAIGNMGQTYLYLNNNQKAAADSLQQLISKFEGASNQGIFAAFYQALDFINSMVNKTGDVMRQATESFNYFFAILRQDFSDPAWAAIFSRSTGLVQQDLHALFNLLSAFIQLIPGLLHDFNFMGLGFLNSATLILRGLAYISEADPTLTRFAYAAYLAYRAYKYLWEGMGTGPGPIQRLATFIGNAATQLSRFAQVARSQGIMTALSLFTGLSAEAIVLTGTLGAVAAAMAYVGFADSKYVDPTQQMIQAMAQQDQATGDNIMGYEKLSNQLLAMENQLKSTTQVYGLTAGQADVYRQKLADMSSAQQQAAQTANTLRSNFSYLENTLHLTQAQAYQVAQALGLNMAKAFGPTQRMEINSYVQSLNAARNPLSAIAYGWQQASNQALQLDDRVTGLTNAFNALLTPFNDVIQAQVTFKDDLVTLTQDLNTSSGAVNYNTAAGRAAANQMAQSALDAESLSEKILTQTGSVRKAAAPLQTMISYLESLHSHSQLVAQEIKILQQYIDQLHSKQINLHFNITTTGGVPSAYVQGETGHAVAGAMQYASGTSGARAGWALVGERGPELVRMRGGETVIPNEALSGYANGTGDAGGLAVKVYLDGKELSRSMATATHETNFRNGNRLNGGRPTGVLRPR